MTSTRRGVLRAAALLQSSLLGGCFGGTDGTEAESESSGGGDGGATGTPERTSVAPEPTRTPAAESPLTAATAGVIAEYEWFRTEYGPAVRGFRRRANRAVGTIRDLEAADSRSESDVERLRSAAADVADHVTGALAGHFTIDRALRVDDNVYVRDFRRAVARGDGALQNSVLSRARAFYRTAASRDYVENELSRRPVHGPFYDMLVPGEADRIVALTRVDGGFLTWAHPDRTESTAGDGIARHTHEFPGGYHAVTHAHSHPTAHTTRDHSNEPPYDRLYAVGDDGVALLTDAAPWRERLDDFEPALTGLFRPVQSDGRTAGLSVLVGGVDDAFTSYPLYVERFDTAMAARTAVGSTSGGGGEAVVSTEGTESFAGREWTRVFYDLDGTTVYAYHVREGATLVTALPSDVPWGERGDWTVALGHAWITATAPDG